MEIKAMHEYPLWKHFLLCRKLEIYLKTKVGIRRNIQS